ncbi:helix-turn-helix domain-containing protein [bacterium]|nr:helix-turn-helix domain-containing protein [bacterium]
MTEDELIARDSQRNIAAEILESLQELKAGNWSRQTAFEIQADGTVRRTITRSDGSVEKEELLSGPRWQMLAARSRSGLSQLAFARALGVSKRTLENWEQGRVEPSGAARRLLALAARYPDTLERLSKME